MVCGDCGAAISATDAFCPSCGAKIDRDPVASPVPPATRVCGECGHRNTGGGDICSSCGSRLKGGEPPVVTAPAPARADRGKRPREGGKQARRFEPWQIISAVAVLSFVVYLVVTQISNEPSRQQAPPPLTGGGGNVPLLNPPGSAPVDLGPLEEAVKASPGDAAALLRLANALHDTQALPRAVDAYKKYLTMRPNDPDARTDLGVTYFQLAQADSVNSVTLLQSALKEMLAAQSVAPRHQQSAFNLGVVNLHLGNMEESNRWFKKTVELNKSSDLGIRAQNILTQHNFQP